MLKLIANVLLYIFLFPYISCGNKTTPFNRFSTFSVFSTKNYTGKSLLQISYGQRSIQCAQRCLRHILCHSYININGICILVQIYYFVNKALVEDNNNLIFHKYESVYMSAIECYNDDEKG